MPRYTPEQLALRNASIWTTVQLMLAPIQFLAFLVGVAVTYFYYRDSGTFPFYWVNAAFLFKTFMFALMFYTGAYFEKELFDKWIFSKEFMLEDIGSVIAGIFFLPYYFFAFTGASREFLVWAAFIAYFVYCANSVQYLVRISLEKRGERHSMQGHA
jgi:3-vinyl bacteriochlorophyllide hydratase